MDIEVGDVFWLTVTYPKTNETETRPVVIYDIDNEILKIASFATITTSKIEDFDYRYDKWKTPIFKWKEAGLDKPSYVKANNIATINKEIFTSKNYIGKMSRSDLINAIRKIKEFENSKEDPW